MKWLMKFFVAVHVFLYRLTGGRIGSGVRGYNILLLTTTGRKSGKKRTVPIGYFPEKDGYLVVASGGIGNHPGWFFNLSSNPQVEIQVKDKKMKAKAEILSSEERQTAWNRVVEKAPEFGDLQVRSPRELPLVILHPAM